MCYKTNLLRVIREAATVTVFQTSDSTGKVVCSCLARVILHVEDFIRDGRHEDKREACKDCSHPVYTIIEVIL